MALHGVVAKFAPLRYHEHLEIGIGVAKLLKSGVDDQVYQVIRHLLCSAPAQYALERVMQRVA